MRETVLAEVAQRSPTSPETNLESRAMQVRVPWTQAWLCTKDFRRKCTGAGVAAKSRFPAMQLFGACGCRGKIPSTHGRFLRSFWCREEADYPHSMHKQENSREGGRISVTELQ
ncbi:hypothetical protein NDU88_005352 [Pleurodeles waltl]|uniref:Uncharacterized protein n=1 Tax=Pleurodeles waltl TaxID=8319 RepID=A0AAV7QKQ2_PLEWA|nr:hypothetical protein NDU88_005352 [Pleurodeles waltl]